jgi:hypothetical protein
MKFLYFNYLINDNYLGLRIKSSESTKRIDISSQDTNKNLYEKVIKNNYCK